MERFGITLPLRNQYFVMRVGQNFSEKGGKLVSNPDTCVLDWPLTELGREQALQGGKAFADLRMMLWPIWKRMNKLAILNSPQGGKEAARTLKSNALIAWQRAVKAQKRSGKSRGGLTSAASARAVDNNVPPTELELYCSDYKASRQHADEVSRWWQSDDTVSKVNVHLTHLLRERGLGLNVDYGGFDGCSFEEMQQVWSLDMMDGSHRLGGVESCEQVLSRVMQLIREIEFTSVGKQVVLVAQQDLAHIMLTIFANQRPGAHRGLPLLAPGAVRELKFSGTSRDAGSGQDEGEGGAGDAGRERLERTVRLYLAASASKVRHRDALLRRAVPEMSDMCARRGAAFSLVDLRQVPTAGEGGQLGSGLDALAQRLALVDSCNAFVCLLDPHDEAPRGLSEKMLLRMDASELVAMLEDGLSAGKADRAIENLSELASVCMERLEAYAQRALEAEKQRQAEEGTTGMLHREVEEAQQQAGREAAERLSELLPGFQEIRDVQRELRGWLDTAVKVRLRQRAAAEATKAGAEGAQLVVKAEPPSRKKETGPQSAAEWSAALQQHLLDLLADGDDELVLPRRVRGLLWLALKRARTSLAEFSHELILAEVKVEALRRASDKYPWVSRWFDASLLELEGRHAAMSSVPAITRKNSIFFQFQPDERRRRSMLERRPSSASTPSRRAPSPTEEVSVEGSPRSETDDVEASAAAALVVAVEGEAEEGGELMCKAEEVEGLLEALAVEGVTPMEYDSPEEMAGQLIEEFEALVERMYPSATAPTWVDQDAMFNEALAREATALYVPDPLLASACAAHAQGDAARLIDMGVYNSRENLMQGLTVVGAEGCGKRSLLAHAALQHKRAFPEDLLLMHMAGSSRDARDPVRMLRRFTLTLQGKTAETQLGVKMMDAAYLSQELNRAMERFQLQCKGARRAVVVLDGIDLFSEEHTNIDLWLPNVFPSAVRVLISCCNGPFADTLKQRRWSTIRVPTLSGEARAAIAGAYLARLGATLSKDQMRVALGSPFTCQPLFLAGLAQQCVLCHSAELRRSTDPAPVLRELDRSRDVHQLFANMLAALDHRYGDSRGMPGLVERALSLLWASRRGLLEMEVFQALAQDFTVTYEEVHLLLEGMRLRVVEVCGRLRLFHGLFILAVETRYLGRSPLVAATPKMAQAHRTLASYFGTMRDTALRKVEEYPFQLSAAVRLEQRHAQITAELASTVATDAPAASSPGGKAGTAGPAHKARSHKEGAVESPGPRALADIDELERYLLDGRVLQEMCDSRFFGDLCECWQTVCWQPGSLSEIGGKYMGSLQQLVIDTGIKIQVPFLCFSVAILLEELSQYRPAQRVLFETIRTIEHLMLHHPFLLFCMDPALRQQLVLLKPKVLLHLCLCLRLSGFYGRAMYFCNQLIVLVNSTPELSWARPDTCLEAGRLASIMGNLPLAEELLRAGSECLEATDVAGQARILGCFAELYRADAMVALAKSDFRKARLLLDREHKIALHVARMWRELVFLEPNTERHRPRSALTRLLKRSRGRPASASWASIPAIVSYSPQTPNCPTSATISFTWLRSIDVNDRFHVQITQLRGADRDPLEVEGPSAYHFSFTWDGTSRSLTFKAIRPVPPGHCVEFTIPEVEGLRLPVKQGGVAAKLDDRLDVRVTKARVVRELADFPVGGGGGGGRPDTADSSKRPGSTGTGAPRAPRPGTGASEVDFEEDEDGQMPWGSAAGEEGDGELRGSHDSARQLAHLGDILCVKAEVQRLRHAHLIGVRDQVLSARHDWQLREAEWQLRHAHDPRLVTRILAAIGNQQVNELDGAYAVYRTRLEEERSELSREVQRALDQAVEVQQALSGESHPSVTDTVMILVRMLLRQGEYARAVPLLVKVWESRTNPLSPERLPLGHTREMACSLFHVGVAHWLDDELRAATVLLEALFHAEERHKRNLAAVRSLLALAHVTTPLLVAHVVGPEVAPSDDGRKNIGKEGVPHLGGIDGRGGSVGGRGQDGGEDAGLDRYDRIALVAQHIQETKVVRPLDLSHARLASRDCLGREKALIPPTTLPAWEAVSECLASNELLTSLDVSHCALGHEGTRQLARGLRHNRVLSTLYLAGNNVGQEGAVHVASVLAVHAALTELDLAGNSLSDGGVRRLAEGLAYANLCRNSSLRRLNLAENALSGDAALTLSLALKTSGVRIASLDMSGNAIGDLGAAHLADVLLVGDSPLAKLALADCQVADLGAAKLGEALAVSATLRTLILSNERAAADGTFPVAPRPILLFVSF